MRHDLFPQTCTLNQHISVQGMVKANVKPLPQKTLTDSPSCSSYPRLTVRGLIWSQVSPKPSWPCSPQPHVFISLFSEIKNKGKMKSACFCKYKSKKQKRSRELYLASDKGRVLSSSSNISNLYPIKSRDFLQICFF